MKKVSGVYAIRNKINGKMYIGSSVNIKKRFYEHERLLQANKHHCRYLQHAYKKYGANSFDYMIVYECCENKDVLLFYEQWFINLYGDYNTSPTACSPLGTKHTEEFREHIKNRMIGKLSSEETKRKCQIAHNGYPVIQISLDGNILGRWKSVADAARELKISSGNISNSVNLYRKCLNTLFVKSESDIWSAIEQYNQKITNGHNKQILSGKKHSKSICQIDKDTGLIIKTWDSLASAARHFNIHSQRISDCLSGKREMICGFKWKYFSES